jgi:hypothetical protein
MQSFGTERAQAQPAEDYAPGRVQVGTIILCQASAALLSLLLLLQSQAGSTLASGPQQCSRHLLRSTLQQSLQMHNASWHHCQPGAQKQQLMATGSPTQAQQRPQQQAQQQTRQKTMKQQVQL